MPDLERQKLAAMGFMGVAIGFLFAGLGMMSRHKMMASSVGMAAMGGAMAYNVRRMKE